MARSLFEGSAALTAAVLLSASLTYYAHPSAAETLTIGDQQNQTQQTSSAAGSSTTTASAASSDKISPSSAGAAPPLLDGEDPEELTDTTLKSPVKSFSLPSVRSVDLNLALPAPLRSKRAPSDVRREWAAPPQAFAATAYSLRGRTASGRTTARGLIAADHKVLPLGTRVHLDAGPYSGEYLVADGGSGVRGRRIDIWVPDNNEARRFGRRAVKLTVLNYGAKRAARRRRTRR